jgi:exonuclease VII large subunit
VGYLGATRRIRLDGSRRTPHASPPAVVEDLLIGSTLGSTPTEAAARLLVAACEESRALAAAAATYSRAIGRIVEARLSGTTEALIRPLRSTAANTTARERLDTVERRLRRRHLAHTRTRLVDHRNEPEQRRHRKVLGARHIRARRRHAPCLLANGQRRPAARPRPSTTRRAEATASHTHAATDAGVSSAGPRARITQHPPARKKPRDEKSVR